MKKGELTNLKEKLIGFKKFERMKKQNVDLEHNSRFEILNYFFNSLQ
jgi:hypothetical protein